MSVFLLKRLITLVATLVGASLVVFLNIKGLWKDMPIFCNDLSSLSWA